MNELKHHVMLANHYLDLSNATEDYATFHYYHELALHHLAKAREHDLDGIVVDHAIPELRKIINR